MKALACADLHIDINNRPEDTIAVLRQMMVYAVKNKIQAVYVVGDIYERRRPYNSEKALFEKFVKYLIDRGIEVIIIAGNHDSDKDGVTAVEEFGILDLPSVSLKANPSIIELGKFEIFLGHMLVQGAKLGPVDYQVGSSISVKSILNKWKADLYILGDVHKAQKLNDNPPMIYVGSPERVDFGERNEKKGFTLIETGKDLTYKFIPLNTRPMVQFDLTYEELNKWLSSTNSLNRRIKTQVKDAIVKFRLTCNKEEYRKIDELVIRKHLGQAKYITIEYDIIKKTRIRSKKIKETSSPAVAFKNYAKLNEIDKETINLGLKLIEESK